MKIKIPYGEAHQVLTVDPKMLAGVLEVEECPAIPDEVAAIEEALSSPIGCKRLLEIVKTKGKAPKTVIVVNDITRPAPSELLVKALVKELGEAGMPDENITLVVATGSHRPNTHQEFEKMLGWEIVNRFRIENHLCEEESNLKYVGATKRGLPLYINKTVAEADIRILTGVIFPHHTAGFSGGRKSIVPGVTGLKTLKIHHSLPIRPYEPSMGNIDNNPFHDEALEGAKLVGADFILNVVQNAHKQTAAVVAGDMEAAHAEGVKISRKITEVEVPMLADLVITSPGGFPRDINLYQAQKAVSVAEKVVRPQGVIILVAECREGVEESDFPRWMKAAKSPREVIERFKREGFSVGSNKAFMFARALMKYRIIVVTDKIPREELKEMFMDRAETLDDALGMAVEMLGEDIKLVCIPNAGSIVPKRRAC